MRVLRAQPGPLTLSGTNTWVARARSGVGGGPRAASSDAHLARVLEAIDERGGLGGIALTHGHADHSEAVAALRERAIGAPLAAGRGDADVQLAEGARFGPFEAVATPGHAADHFALLAGDACFTGDAVLGEGSVFISPVPWRDERLPAQRSSACASARTSRS